VTFGKWPFQSNILHGDRCGVNELMDEFFRSNNQEELSTLSDALDQPQCWDDVCTGVDSRELKCVLLPTINNQKQFTELPPTAWHECACQ
jgi:hypothetical protein